MSKDTTAAATEKTIVRTGIYKINAERKIMCTPPAFWDVEATIDVYFSDGSRETQYMVISDFDFRCMQINNKSMEELMKSDEEDDDFCIMSFESEEEALESPYGDSFKILLPIFDKITII